MISERLEEQNTIIAWNNFREERDNVEKLVYPMKIGDAYDKGCMNEVHSQVNVFQGSLYAFNSCNAAARDK